MPSDSSAPLRVMTYNIRNAHPDPGHEWEGRLPGVLEIIRRGDADLLGLQEALHPQMSDLVEALHDYEPAGRSRYGDTRDEYVPIFVRRATFELLENGQFWLSGEPDVPGSNTWEGLVTRIVTWVRVRRRADGRELIFAATHFDHDESAHGDRVREQSARLIADRLGDGEAPLILVGDFNALPDSPAHRALEAAGFTDAQFDCPGVDCPGVDCSGADRPGDGDAAPEPIGTFHDYSPWRPGLERIDWVLHMGDVQTVSDRVDTADPASTASDHFPVIAELRV